MAKPLYAWDSCIFIAWLGGDAPPELNQEHLAAVAREITSDDAGLITSVLAYSEVLTTKYTPDAILGFERFLQRRNVTVLDVHSKVAKKAESIRSACLGMDPKRKTKVPDAIFAATAVMLKANVLHSTDAGLIALSGSVILEGLIVKLPAPLSGALPLC